MSRRWQAAPPFDVGGLIFHVVPEQEARSGKKLKGNGHMVLEVWRSAGWTPDGRWRDERWLPVPMDLGFLLADFWWNEEEALYHPSRGFLGGNKYMRYCWDAIYKGWAHACQNLALDKEGKAQRISRPYRGHSAAWELTAEWAETARRQLASDGPPAEASD